MTTTDSHHKTADERAITYVDAALLTRLVAQNARASYKVEECTPQTCSLLWTVDGVVVGSLRRDATSLPVRVMDKGLAATFAFALKSGVEKFCSFVLTEAVLEGHFAVPSDESFLPGDIHQAAIDAGAFDDDDDDDDDEDDYEDGDAIKRLLGRSMALVARSLDLAGGAVEFTASRAKTIEALISLMTGVHVLSGVNRCLGMNDADITRALELAKRLSTELVVIEAEALEGERHKDIGCTCLGCKLRAAISATMTKDAQP